MVNKKKRTERKSVNSFSFFCRHDLIFSAATILWLCIFFSPLIHGLFSAIAHPHIEIVAEETFERNSRKKQFVVLAGLRGG